MTDDQRCSPPDQVPIENSQVPSSPRIWNYWMGGKDNYQVDREIGDRIAEIYPGIRATARESRNFLVRTARFLAEEVGIRQFLDIGTGFPTEPNTYQIAQAASPDSRVVYVDNDPVVLAHARCLLVSRTSKAGPIGYVDADVHDPDAILTAARRMLEFTQPVAVQFFGVLGHVADFAQAKAIVARAMEAVPSGSYLALRDSTNTNPAYDESLRLYTDSGAIPYNLRSPDQITEFFTGLELVEPKVVSVSRWRPYEIGPGSVGTTEPVDNYGGVARKP